MRKRQTQLEAELLTSRKQLELLVALNGDGNGNGGGESPFVTPATSPLKDTGGESSLKRQLLVVQEENAGLKKKIVSLEKQVRALKK